MKKRRVDKFCKAITALRCLMWRKQNFLYGGSPTTARRPLAKDKTEHERLHFRAEIVALIIVAVIITIIAIIAPAKELYCIRNSSTARFIFLVEL